MNKSIALLPMLLIGCKPANPIKCEEIMPKYYVNAGELKKIIDRPTPRIAAVDSFKSLEINPVSSLSTITEVSEVGFNSNNENDWFFSTVEILEQSNQIGYYKEK